MIDKSVPHASVIMVKHDMDNYPRYELPEGFVITGYKDGYEKQWAEIAMEQFYFESVEKGLEIFKDEFGGHPEWLDRCLFAVEEKTGRVAAMTALWEGGVFTEDYKRIHWVATRQEYQGRGIIKALLSHALDLYHALNSEGMCFLVTQTTSWQAIRIYKKFGFQPYLGVNPGPRDAFDAEKHAEAWRLIDAKLAEYEAARA